MPNVSLPIPDNIYHYIRTTSICEPPILTELRLYTQQHCVDASMQISPEQGQLIHLLLTLLNAKHVLELGTYTGYSALTMAYALPPEGTVTSCDVSPSRTAIAQQFWQKSGLAHKIKCVLAPAVETLNDLIAHKKINYFDFALIDADKANYIHYYEQCLQLLRPGGLIMLDNMLLSGRVTQLSPKDNSAKVIHQLNQHLQQDSRVVTSLLPMGDGISLVCKRSS